MDSSAFRFVPFREQDNRYVPLVAMLAVILIALWFIFGFAYRAEFVNGDSMLNTLQSGDRLLMTRTYPTPTRGDIISANVVIEGTPDRIIKRVVAIPGDTVEVESDVVWVNGVPATWPGVIMGPANGFRIDPFEILPGTVYLLGDNRPGSLDSRYIGPVAISKIRGKAVAIFSPLTRIRRID